MQPPLSPPQGGDGDSDRDSDVRRLKLSMTSAMIHSRPDYWHFGGTTPPHTGHTTPPQPAYSPVTPTLSQADVTGAEQDYRDSTDDTTWTEEPDPLPLSMDENPDEIALRAAISILQLQRHQSLKDIQELDRMKIAALKDPDAFVEELRIGSLGKSPKIDVNVDDTAEESSDDDVGNDVARQSNFGHLPARQNVVRCPPVNWDKYHVIGESLDKMHEEQRRYPGTSNGDIHRSGNAPEHVVAAPYRPFLDKLEGKSTTGSGTSS